jgi:hypothetical protein
MLGSERYASQSLQTAVEQAKGISDDGLEQAVTLLRKALSEVQKDLNFQPLMEAKQPTGFPALTAIGEVELKLYPAYRKAQAETSPNRAFMTIFSHIKRNNIAMTAPVEMDYDATQTAEPKQQNMAFLYGDSNLGKPGIEGSVSVIDVQAMKVISTGVRGMQNTSSVRDARGRLEAWLESNKANGLPPAH